MKPLKDSPVETERKSMPRGDGNWPGYDHVYDRLKLACENLSKGIYTRCSADHIYMMAALGSGHEETMKYALGLAKTYGWC